MPGNGQSTDGKPNIFRVVLQGPKKGKKILKDCKEKRGSGDYACPHCNKQVKFRYVQGKTLKEVRKRLSLKKLKKTH